METKQREAREGAGAQSRLGAENERGAPPAKVEPAETTRESKSAADFRPAETPEEDEPGIDNVSIQAARKGADEPGTNAKHRFYDKVPLTVKQLDIILIVLAVLFVVFLTLGALVGNGILPKTFRLF